MSTAGPRRIARPLAGVAGVLATLVVLVPTPATAGAFTGTLTATPSTVAQGETVVIRGTGCVGEEGGDGVSLEYALVGGSTQHAVSDLGGDANGVWTYPIETWFDLGTYVVTASCAGADGVSGVYAPTEFMVLERTTGATSAPPTTVETEPIAVEPTFTG